MSSYMLPSKVAVLKHINEKNATTFAAADLTFGAPQVINGTWRELANPHNTALRVTAAVGGKYQGTQVITYDRLKLSDLVNIPGFMLAADNPTTVWSLFTGLLYYNGLHLDADDLEDSAVTKNPDGTFTATLTAKATSLGWIGSHTLTFAQGGAAMDTLITTADMPGLNYPTASDTDVFAALYLYGYDFTPYYADLVDVEEGEVLTQHQADALAAAFRAVDKSSGAALWNGVASTITWSLAGAVATHSGMNGADLPTNTSYKYAVLLKLRDDVTSPRGTLIIHYNDPVDPGAV